MHPFGKQTITVFEIAPCDLDIFRRRLDRRVIGIESIDIVDRFHHLTIRRDQDGVQQLFANVISFRIQEPLLDRVNKLRYDFDEETFAMTLSNSPRRSFQARRVCCLLFGIGILLAVPPVVCGQTINSKVVRFLAANVGKRIGAGQSTDAVAEALRTAAAAFTQFDLGSDFPDQGDRMWGTPVKVLSYKNGVLADSNPLDDVLPGDILQYKGAKFVYVTDSGRKTTTTTVTANQHTSVAARVNPKTKLPVRVYEQNAPAVANTSNFQVSTNSIDFTALRAGTVFVYRPKSRIDDPVKYQISIVNNTSSNKVPTLKSGIKTVARVSLEPSTSASSYTTVWANATTPKTGLSLVLPNGESIDVTNAASYEIYKKPNGIVAIRKITP